MRWRDILILLAFVLVAALFAVGFALAAQGAHGEPADNGKDTTSEIPTTTTTSPEDTTSTTMTIPESPRAGASEPPEFECIGIVHWYEGCEDFFTTTTTISTPITSTTPAQLPFTGPNLLVLAAMGLTFIGTGVYLLRKIAG